MPTRTSKARLKGKKKRRILLTDSDPTFLAHMARSLEVAGFEVLATTDSARAWKLAARSRPDLAILDVSMRGMGRFDVAINMNASLAMYRMLYLFLAARSPDREGKHSREVRAVAFLKKPFSRKAILSLAKSLL